jgi:hypothetical protein
VVAKRIQVHSFAAVGLLLGSIDGRYGCIT